MTTDEQRLARLLKSIVPEPPIQLSADQVTARSAGPSARSWTVPALAAAAVAAIGVTAGLVAAHQTGPGGSPAPMTVSSGSASGSPAPSVSCAGRTVTVPNVIGVSQDAAGAIIQGAGLTAGLYFHSSAQVPQGTVIAQSLSGGSKAVPGAEVILEIAQAPSTSTAPPIDPGFNPTGSPTPLSPCQVVTGTPPPSNAIKPVPNVIGMAASQAVAVARANGFSVSTVTTAAPASHPVPPGTVFAQSPAAGSKAMPRTGMILYIAPAA